MSMDENMSRWIMASVAKHFDARHSTIPMYIEGQPRVIKNDAVEHFELRQDGPDCTEVSKDYWRCYIEINILVMMAKSKTDAYRIRRLTGIIQKAFTKCIEVYRYGDGILDDKSYIGTLKLLQGQGEKLQTAHFGQIGSSTNQEQAIVEGHYEMFLTVKGD